jgi:hypothetical protein
MKKLKLKILIEIYYALVRLGHTQSEAFYAFAKNKRKLRPHIDEHEATRQDLVKQLAKKDKSGEPIVQGEGRQKQYDFTPANLKKFNKTLEELEEKEIEVEFHKIKLSKIQNEKHNANDIEIILEHILVDEE